MRETRAYRGAEAEGHRLRHQGPRASYVGAGVRGKERLGRMQIVTVQLLSYWEYGSE